MQTDKKHLTRRSPQSESNSMTQGSVLGRWFAAAFLHWQRSRMTVALDRLDDRMLYDIGLHRSDIPGAVERMTRRELRMTPVSESPAQPDISPSADSPDLSDHLRRAA